MIVKYKTIFKYKLKGEVHIMKIKIIKFDGYKKPERAHYNDSGADVFAAKDIIIPAGKVVKVPTGVGTELPNGYDIVIHCKSGLNRGEIHAILYNTTNEDFIINAGDKIGQIVVRPVIYAEFVDDLGEERNTGGFGSTGL